MEDHMKPKKLIKLLAIFVIALFSAQYAAAQTGQRYLHPVFAAVDIRPDQQYGSAVNYRGQVENLFLDFYQPRGDTLSQRPLVIYVHGGGFKEFDRKQMHIKALCDNLARRGYVAASIDYRLVDTLKTIGPAAYRASIDAMHDAKAAVRFFRHNARSYKIDTTKIFIGGESAGGVTAANVAYIDKLSEIDSCCVSLHSVEGNSGNAGYSSAVAACLEMCGLMWDTTAIERPSDPRLFVAHGTADRFVLFDEALKIVKRAENVGLAHTFLRFERADHCPWFVSLSPQAYLDTLVQQISLFLYPMVGGRAIRIADASASPGNTVSIPIMLTAQGNENSSSFSLEFDPAVLSHPQAKLGKDAGAATLILNDSEINSGHFGISLALPAGQTFSASTRELMLVSFSVDSNTTAESTPLKFGDQPIVRKVIANDATALSATWAGGTLKIIRCTLQQLARAEKVQGRNLAVDSKFEPLRQFRDTFLSRYEEGNEYIAMYYAFGDFVKIDPASLLQSVAALPHLYKAVEALQNGKENAVIVTPELHRSMSAIIANHREVKDQRLQKMLDRVERDLNRFQGMRKSELLSLLRPTGESLSSDVESAEANMPEDFTLAQNFPNPFNPETTIKYAIPAQPSGKVHVTLRIYNLQGQAVRTLVDEEKAPGRYQVMWDGKNEAGVRVSSGVYLYTITAGSFKATKKLAILK
jgi:acetyl esterase/lipase